MQRHGNAENPGLHCRQEPGGVGNGGNKVNDENGNMMPDGSVDFVIISETHIADVQIGADAGRGALPTGFAADNADCACAQVQRRKKSSTKSCAS